MNYVYDLNTIMQRANAQGNYEIESLCLNLEHVLSSTENTSTELEKVMDNTIEFLYGVVG